MIRRRTFGHHHLQRVYDYMRAAEPDARVRVQGSAGWAYWLGRYCAGGEARPPRRGSMAYAAWAAGVDDRRELEH